LGKAPKLVGKIQSKIDKIDDIVIQDDGTVVHKILTYHSKVQGKRGID